MFSTIQCNDSYLSSAISTATLAFVILKDWLRVTMCAYHANETGLAGNLGQYYLLLLELLWRADAIDHYKHE